MKCIYCNTDSTYRERSDGSCKRCHRRFAFEPKTMNKQFVLTDKAFQAAINAVSEKDTLFFTPRQLYYQLLSLKVKPPKQSQRALPGFAAVFFVIFFSIWIPGFVGGMASSFTGNNTILLLLAGIVPPTLIGLLLAKRFVPLIGIAFWLSTIIGELVALFTKNWQTGLVIGIGLFVIGLLLRFLVPTPRGKGAKKLIGKLAKRPPISYDYFKTTLLDRWLAVHGQPIKMLPEGGRLRPALHNQSESDMQQYSFDRLLVVDKAETVDVLLANNLHFETNMPIVSLDGYPQDVFPEVLKTVRRNLNLKVFTLHDTDAKGCLLPLRLREDSRWFPQPNIAVIDLGLTPRQIAAQPDLLLQKQTRLESLPPELKRNLSPGERRWLQAGNYAELANFRPARLMRAIFQSLQRAAEEEQRLKAAAASDPRGFFQTSQPIERHPTDQPPTSGGLPSTR
jgi:hypothetical protein